MLNSWRRSVRAESTSGWSGVVGSALLQQTGGRTQRPPHHCQSPRLLPCMRFVNFGSRRVDSQQSISGAKPWRTRNLFPADHRVVYRNTTVLCVPSVTPDRLSLHLYRQKQGLRSVGETQHAQPWFRSSLLDFKARRSPRCLS